MGVLQAPTPKEDRIIILDSRIYRVDFENPAKVRTYKGTKFLKYG